MNVRTLALISEYPELAKKAFLKIQTHDKPCRGVYISYVVSQGAAHLEFEFDSFTKRLRDIRKNKHGGCSYP